MPEDSNGGEEVSFDPETDQIMLGEGDNRTPLSSGTKSNAKSDADVPTDESEEKAEPGSDDISESDSEDEENL